MNIENLQDALFEAQMEVSDADMTVARRELEVWMFDADICALVNELNEEICQLVEKVMMRRDKIRKLRELRGQCLREYTKDSEQFLRLKAECIETSRALRFAYEAQRSAGDSDGLAQPCGSTDRHEQPDDGIETVVHVDHVLACGLSMRSGSQTVVATVEATVPAQQDASESLRANNQPVSNVNDGVGIVAHEASKYTKESARSGAPRMEPQPAARPVPKQTKPSSNPGRFRAGSASKTDAAQAKTSSSEKARLPVAKGRRLMTPLEPGDDRLSISGQHIGQGTESAHRASAQGPLTTTAASPVGRRNTDQTQPTVKVRGSTLPVRVKPPFLRPNGQKYGP